MGSGEAQAAAEKQRGQLKPRRRKPFQAPPICCAPYCPIVLPLAPLAPPVLSPTPSVLPLKRPCSLSQTKTVIPNPKFGVYVIYIYILHKPRT